MNHSRALCGGLLLSVAIAPLAWSQTPPRRPTVSERISALGRTLTGNGQSQEEEAQAAAAGAAAARATQPRAGFPQVDAKSLLPSNRFGTQPNATGSTQRSTANAPAQGQAIQPRAGSNQTSRPQPNRQNSAAGNAAARTAQRAASGAAGNDEAFEEHYVLPGLGGSPLPTAARSALSNTTETGQEVIADAPPAPAIAPSAGGATSRSFPTAASAAASARSSPARRAPMNVDASELRHELAGAYPAANATAPTRAMSEDTTMEPTAHSNAATNASNSGPQTNENIFTLPSSNAATSSGSAPRFDAGTPIMPPRADSQPLPLEAKERFENSGEPSTTSPATQFRVTPVAPSTPNRPNPATPAGGRRIFGEVQSAAGESNVLVMNQAPIISTDIRGPKQIVVGREATFHVRVHNQGNAAADGIDVSVRVPSWATVVSTNTTTGNVAQSPTSEIAGTLRWQIVRLDAGASESLELRVIPRSSRPLELGVNWSVTPVGSRAVVEVQEPKLEMNVSGPDEVLFGRPQTYRFTLTNPGTGVAENVRVDLYPPGGGEKPAGTNQVGNLLPGKSQTIEVELVARDAGKLAIKAVAVADGDLNCSTTKEVFCRKPELAIDWRGPDTKYAGTDATYFIRVRNPGTAPAEDVTVRATLPEGAQMMSASEGQVFDAAKREIAWRVGSLGPGDDYYMELKCNVTSPGKNQLKLAAATSTGDLSDNKFAETNVIALADLKLEVSDPSGPVAITDEAIYEIRIQNRGASAARDINVIALFSAGIEPVHIDGGQYSVSDGRVSFRAIEELAVGRQAVLKIRAKAVQPGTHVFRAEVLCRDLEIKLAAEETTRFFADDSTPAGESGINQAGKGFDSSPVR